MRHIVGVVFSVAAVLLVMMCMPRTGAIYTHDSQSYEYAASTLLESGEMKYFGYDTPIIQWPPFYIFVSAAIKLAGVPFAQGAAWVNAFAFAYLVYTASVFLFDCLNVKWLAVPALAMIIISVPLIFISGYAWSEMLFIFLSVLSIALILEYIKREKQSWLVAATVISSLCWLTRYIGIVVIGVSAIVLLIWVEPFWEKIKKTFVYMVFSCFPMALWVIRNYIFSETFTGGRLPGIYTFKDNADFSMETFKGWISFSNPMFAWISAALFALFAMLAISMKKNSRKKKKSSPELFAFFLYIVLYCGVLLISASKSGMDPLDDRLWSPVFPFWIFTLVLAFDRLFSSIKMTKAVKWMAAGFTLSAVIAVVNPAIWLQSEGLPRKDALIGSKESPIAKQSPVLKFAMEHIKPDADTLVISNKASDFALHTNLKCYYPPKKNGIPLYSYSQYSERIENFKTIYLVWAGDPISESFMDIPEFREKYELEKTAQNEYCIIYRLK
ncbi:MAG: glycosyltransferase [Clostridiaceae bacterium]|nr:glycosyltransferase [Clostridiaceae bacterium]